jgi:hypothetical protein
MHPFSSYTTQRIAHEHMVQEAMEQAHIDAQLSSGRSPFAAVRHFLHLLPRFLPLKQRQQASVVYITSMKNSYSRNHYDGYSSCDSGPAC